MQVKVLGFEVLKEQYQDDEYFSKLWEECSKGPFNRFLLQDGFLFRDNQLCIPEGSLREVIIKEAHDGGLAGHFGKDKTLSLVEQTFYWPKLSKDVARYVERCQICRRAKPVLKILGCIRHYQSLPLLGKM